MPSINFKNTLEVNRTSVVPKEGELIITNDTNGLYIGDGITPGGNLMNGTDGLVRNKEVSFISTNGENSGIIIYDSKAYTFNGSHEHLPYYATGRGPTSNIPYYAIDNAKLVSYSSSSPIKYAGGNNHQVAFILLESGELFTTGLNNQGACGLGHFDITNTFVLAATDVQEAYYDPTNGDSDNEDARLFIKKTDGYIYGTGYNAFGQLGLGDTTTRNTFTQITSLGTDVESFWNMGSTTGCAIAQKTDGSIWAAGYNAYGQLGTGNTTNQTSFVDVTTAWGGGAGITLKQVVGGFGFNNGAAQTHTFIMMLLDDNTNTYIKTCGNNTYSQLGDGTTTQRTTPVIPNIGTGRVAEISAQGGGTGTIMVRKENGELYTWGYNGVGQLGIGTTNNNSNPSLIVSDCTKLFSNGHTIISNGFRNGTYIQRSDGQTYSAGYNAHGQLGVGDTINRTTFTRVLLPYNDPTKFIGGFNASNSGLTIVYVTEGNRIYYCGTGSANAVNANSSINSLTPIQAILTENN